MNAEATAPTKRDPLASYRPVVRDDLLHGHRAAWRHVATPGCWFSGVQRVQIAAAVRHAWDCALCAARRSALSPVGITGEHDGESALEQLPAPVVDAVHRLVTDQNRLGRGFVDDLVHRSELPREAYSELVGVVSQVVSLDVLHLALGIDLAPLPEPVSGNASGYVPPGLAMEDAWVPMISPADLGPQEADLYGEPTGNVVRALSAVPDEVRAMKSLSAAQYIAIAQMRDYVGGERVGRNLSRAQMELLAGRISALHECFY